MVTITNTFKEKLTKIFVPSIFYSLLLVALFCLYFYFHSFAPFFTPIIPHQSSLSSSPPLRKGELTKREKPHEKPCDYFNGNWINDKRGPLYNGTTCSEIKKSRNCIVNGRPDSNYLYWRWKPKECDLPIFEPNTFLTLINNMNIAFVGDSLARNQIESLVCLLSSHYKKLDL
ncbi:Pmr5/Cas1p GDSL/SGNH-like acyl-esterase family protein [Medicago truncatula]|uniref:Pmr5/Cas1p GDSL/SGNH-like acyl-esterase family protein n=1 Tax=Medicago truncatula TaxID=3880 RepID=G7K2U0_MEDTR|nr:Pmr5/Cas1p GDSL/SGNH-like acyl-esterase family protein [Medicago truncatula]